MYDERELKKIIYFYFGNVEESDFNLIFQNMNNDMNNCIEGMRFFEQLDKVDEDGNTVLMYLDSPDLIELFLRAGLSPNTRNRKGESPLLRAIQQSRDDPHVVSLLLNYGATFGTEELVLSVKSGLNQVFSELIRKRSGLIDLRDQDRFGNTLLMLAIKYKNVPLIKKILNHMDRTIVNHVNRNNENAVFIAAKTNQLDLVKILAQNYGADLKRRNSMGVSTMDLLMLIYRMEHEKSLGKTKYLEWNKNNEIIEGEGGCYNFYKGKVCNYADYKEYEIRAFLNLDPNNIVFFFEPTKKLYGTQRSFIFHNFNEQVYYKCSGRSAMYVHFGFFQTPIMVLASQLLNSLESTENRIFLIKDVIEEISQTMSYNDAYITQRGHCNTEVSYKVYNIYACEGSNCFN